MDTLNATRDSVCTKVGISSFELYVHTSFLEGKPVEVFITIAAVGSTLRGICRLLGVLISTCLRNGVSWADLKEKLQRTSFEPNDTKYASIAHAVVWGVEQNIQYNVKKESIHGS